VDVLTDGELVKTMRLARDWTRQELAQKAGLDWGSINAIERGTRRMSVGTAKAICHVFEVSLAVFDATITPDYIPKKRKSKHGKKAET
jgi:DNA-binding XRE family transcriptional regulator